jgi:UDP-N-acetylmuramate--alanine ligase
MSGIAQVLKAQGHEVLGSDRSYDRGQNAPLYSKLKAQGIRLVRQDGSAMDGTIDYIVVSTAIDADNPERQKADALKLKILKRAELLAQLVNPKRSVAIGGTSGKSTTAAMAAWILDRAGLDPTVINGGNMRNFVTDTLIGNAKLGRSDVMCIEADESDGTIELYHPVVGAVTNISKDHKEIPVLQDLFRDFSTKVSGTFVASADCPHSIAAGFQHKALVTYGIKNNADVVGKDISLSVGGASFQVDGTGFTLRVPGIHNVENALVAIASARGMGVRDEVSSKALAEFLGVKRRLEVIGEAGGVTVIDDFAHNPEKIEASFEAVRPGARRIIGIFQPHGFRPTSHMRAELVRSCAKKFQGDNSFFMTKIYYAGGHTEMNITSEQVVEDIRREGGNARCIPERPDIVKAVAAEAQPGDVVLVMGARDDTLTEFCHEIVRSLSAR